jgi:endoribonuclease Dicer
MNFLPLFSGSGGGKTLIGVLVINHFLNIQPKKWVCFLVPSRALVVQQVSESIHCNFIFHSIVFLRFSFTLSDPSQARYLERFCHLGNDPSAAVSVAQVCGREMEGWGQQQWNSTLRDNRILVGTPEVFRSAMVDSGFLHISQFSLLVFDECHNAVGNAPMAAIMRDAVCRAPEDQQPRILGLTASFVNSAVSGDLTKKRRAIETTFQATMISPSIPAVESGDDGVPKDFHAVEYHGDDFSIYRTPFETFLHSEFQKLPSEVMGDLQPWIKRGVHLLESLGFEAVKYWIRFGLLYQLTARAAEFELMPQPETQRIAKMIRRHLKELETQLEIISDSADVIQFPSHTQQLLKLIELLRSLDPRVCF